MGHLYMAQIFQELTLEQQICITQGLKEQIFQELILKMRTCQELTLKKLI